MKNYAKLPLIIFVFVLLFLACNQSKSVKKEESMTEGSTSIFVDETLVPIVEDQIAVFESDYKAKIKLIPNSETETVNSFLKEKSGIAILSRNLTTEELKIFEHRKITPRITKFAIDAIAFISNKNNKDTIIALKDVVSFMQGKSVKSIKGLVFDNLNSSTVRYINELSGMKGIPEKNVFSFKTNNEVIKYVSENNGMIGVVGVNWISQPLPAMQKYIGNVNVLGVKGLTENNYYIPSQNNIAEGKYPLARDLYIINCQGFSGLGMGFTSFVSGDIGQRIILKSGLLPVHIPRRNIKIRDNNSSEDKK